MDSDSLPISCLLSAAAWIALGIYRQPHLLPPMSYLQSFLEVFIPMAVGAACAWAYFAGRKDRSEVEHNADLTEQARALREHFSAHLRKLNQAHWSELALRGECATRNGIEQFQLGYKAGALRTLEALNLSAAKAGVAPPKVHLPPPYLRG